MTDNIASEYDVVVGGGTAGLSGALRPARARRSVLVIDADEPLNTPAAAINRDLIAADTAHAVNLYRETSSSGPNNRDAQARQEERLSMLSQGVTP